MDDSVWDVTVFTKNRERLVDGDIAEAFFQAVLRQARERSLLSDEHFTVDGTLLEAWASVKSFQRKDGKPMTPPDDPGNATVDFHGETRSNETHESKTDPDAKLARKGKGKEAKLSYNGNLLVTWGGPVGARLMLALHSTPDMPSVRGRGSALKSVLGG
jgi:hypothetical protein